jgi:hypothetical protein
MKYAFAATVASVASALALEAVAQSADDDFAARCSGPGVVRCVGFDNTTSDIVRGQNLHPDGGGAYRAGLDTATKASGTGALRFDLPPPPHAGANIAGSWSPLSNDGLGRLFGQNSTFYAQFRVRFSPEFLNNTWNATWKVVLFHYAQTTCGSIELTMDQNFDRFPRMYTDCGATHMFATLDGSRHTEIPPLLIQQGDYRCEYGNVSTATCFAFVPDEWLTMYYKFTIGTWDQANSLVEAWVAREGEGYRQFIRVPNMRLSCNENSCTTSPGRDQGYNNLTFTPYMTGLSSSSGRAGVTSRIWYDELIVSTQPIAAPSSAPRPVPPPNFQVQ